MLSDLSFYLSQKGFDISVITSAKYYAGAVGVLSSFEEVKGVSVYRVWSSNFDRNRYISRVVNYISLEFSLMIKLFRVTKKDDIVVLMTDPPLFNIVAYPLIRLKGGVVVNWLQDLFPEVAVSADLFTKDSIVNRFFTNLRNKILLGADRNIVIGCKMYDYLSSDVGVNNEKIIKIENWSDRHDIYSIDKKDNHFCMEWGLDEKFVVGYSGNMGRAHDVSTILSVIEKLKSESNILFVFVGGGVGLDKIKMYTKEKKLSNVLFKPYQDRKLLAASLNVADVHLVTLDPKMEGFIVPSKFYGILAASKPVFFIGDSDGELARDINRVGCGENFEIGESDKLTKAIKKYSDNPEHVIDLGKLGRKEFCKSYDFSIAAKKFMKLFNDL